MSPDDVVHPYATAPAQCRFQQAQEIALIEDKDNPIPTGCHTYSVICAPIVWYMNAQIAMVGAAGGDEGGRIARGLERDAPWDGGIASPRNK